jgi:hypothetical protein
MVAMMDHRLKVFAAVLDRAAREYLALRGAAPHQVYRLAVEECPVHGADCARITYGMFRDHVEWEGSDPEHLAAALLRTMLPPIPEWTRTNWPSSELY